MKTCGTRFSLPQRKARTFLVRLSYTVAILLLLLLLDREHLGMRFVRHYLVPPLTRFYLHGAQYLLTLIGYDAKLSENSITLAPSVVIHLFHPCLGIGMTALFVWLVLCYQSTWHHKIKTIALGLLTLVALNTVRIAVITLVAYHTGDLKKNYRTEFDLIVMCALLAVLYLYVEQTKNVPNLFRRKNGTPPPSSYTKEIPLVSK